jgi:nicotinamide-nucleotide amidase
LRQFKVASEAESRLDARIESIYKEYPQVETTMLSSPGVISVYHVWRGGQDPSEAQQTLEELVKRMKDRLGEALFTEAEETLAEVIGRLLRDRGLTLALAESCTGGLIGERITDVPGSSDYFLGGVISYSNQVKSELLGVEPVLLEQYGAVSAPVAEEMAKGARERLAADLALSITGIAGPGGGSAEKPVGTVFFGYADSQGVDSTRLLLPGDRAAVRMRSANMALDWLRRKLL